MSGATQGCYGARESVVFHTCQYFRLRFIVKLTLLILLYDLHDTWSLYTERYFVTSLNFACRLNKMIKNSWQDNSGVWFSSTFFQSRVHHLCKKKHVPHFFHEAEATFLKKKCSLWLLQNTYLFRYLYLFRYFIILFALADK